MCVFVCVCEFVLKFSNLLSVISSLIRIIIYSLIQIIITSSWCVICLFYVLLLPFSSQLTPFSTQLPHPQTPTTFPYPQSDPFNPWLPSHFLKFPFSIILPSMPMPLKRSPSLRSPHQNPVCTYPVSHTCHMPLPSPWFDKLNMWWEVQI